MNRPIDSKSDTAVKDGAVKDGAVKDDTEGEAGQTMDNRGESAEERADRNMNELLQELRVAQAGVQILVAFLLSMSFTERFARIDEFQRWTYVVTLLLSMLTAGLLIAPAAVHRATFRSGLKPEIVQAGHRLFAAGLGTLVLTLAGATLLVMDVAVGRSFAVTCATAVGLVLVGLWYVLPVPLLRHRIREEEAGNPVDADADEPPSEERMTARD